MREAIVILSPYSGCEEDVERCNLLPPLDFEALLNPFTVLIDHGVNDVNERFVAVEQSVSTGQDVAFEPALVLSVVNLDIRVQLTSTVCSDKISITRPS